jgi:hypothetical protein
MQTATKTATQGEAQPTLNYLEVINPCVYSREVVDAVGIEPTTSRLRVECSQYANYLYFH